MADKQIPGGGTIQNSKVDTPYGEKPGEGTKPHGVNHHGEHDGHSLAVQGWTRACALAGLFAHAPSNAHPHVVRPGRILATRPTEEAKSKR